MKSHHLAIGTLAFLVTVVAHSAVPRPRTAVAMASSTTDTPRLKVFGGRSLQQRLSPGGAKLDAALADLARHVNLVSPQNALADLHSLSPAAKFVQRAPDATPLVLIDAVTRGDVQQLKSALMALGLQNPSVYLNDVSGWLPVTQIDAATARVELHSIRAAMSRARSGAVTSQGDFAQHSDVLRNTYSTLTGSGITVGALSDSYNCYPVYAQNHVSASGPAGYADNGFLATASTDVTSGDLPSGVNVAREAPCMSYGAPTQLPFGDEGRAMLQIVHDVAPGAGLAFYTAENGEADFANGIQTLASAGAKVIVDDVGYFDEPFFQDGLVAQAIDKVVSQGVAYFSAAGNDGHDAYENTTPSFANLSNSAPTTGEYLLNFDNSGGTTATSLAIDIPSLEQGQLVALILQWDQPYVTGAAGSPGASSHLDLCVTAPAGNDKIIKLDGNTATCTGPNATGSDPVQILIVSNPANASAPSAAETINVTIGLADGTPQPGRIKFAVEGGGLHLTIHSQFASNPALQGHPGAAGAAAVGAAAFYATPGCGVTPATLEYYSAEGGSPILFDTSGTRLATQVVRQKPDFVGPDGGNDTFLGFQIAAGRDTSSVAQCADNSSYPNFFGTSAAAPHAAAIAALMLQVNPLMAPADIYAALRKTALSMGGTAPNFNSGYGFIQADAALATLPPSSPSLKLAKTSVTPGGSTTLTWSSINATDCMASGDWTGAQPTSGSTTVTAPATAAASANYTLKCNNANGSSSSTILLGVATASGGGGAVDLFALCMLGILGAARLINTRRAVRA